MPYFRGYRCAAFLIAALSLVGFVGCGDGTPDNVTISGKVVHANGKPLSNAMIIFSPVGDADAAPQAMVGKDGTFELADVGIPPGEYRVFLAPPEEGAPTGEGEPTGSSFNVPQKYRDGESSGWTATIKESGNEPLTFTIG